MLIIALNIQPYLAKYAEIHYKSPFEGIVRFPAESLVNVCIVEQLTMGVPQKQTAEPNIRVWVQPIHQSYKHLDLYRGITPQGEQRIEDALTFDFNIALFKWVRIKTIREGLTIQEACNAFIAKYDLEGIILLDTLVKRYMRWRGKIRARGKKAEALDLF